MKFYVVRHPWTEANVNKITQGWADSPLTPKGIAIAEKLGKFLKDKSISRIVSSDLGRCVQTSNIINKKLHVEIVKASQLREQNFGKFNGVHENVIKKELGDYLKVPPDGESFIQMKNRVLNYIKNELPTDKDMILLVTHTGCFKSIISDSLNVDLESEKCKTTPLTIGLFEFKNHNIRFVHRFDID